jgi:hypothetical protein
MSAASLSSVQDAFTAALPGMSRVIAFQLRACPPPERQDTLAVATAAAWQSWVSLVRRGRDPVEVGPAAIAVRAVLYARSGRRFGSGRRGRGLVDVMNRHVQSRHGFRVVGLEDLAAEAGLAGDDWHAWIAMDNTATPADQAAFHLDFSVWLSAMPVRRRKMAELLASGATTNEVAREVGVTAGAVSQTRARLEASWREFQNGDR